MTYPKRLIEVDLPIKKISAHARREKSIRHGHISTLHIWWARRPLAACRAVICAALWPDPVDENCPQAFRDAAAKTLADFAEQVRTDANLAGLVSDHWRRWHRTNAATFQPADSFAVWPDMRAALLDFIADFANWDASPVPAFLETARALTQAAHESLGGTLIAGTRPLVVDPFAGGGAIPLEALRVGADAFASDLNPVAVLLNKVVLEYMPRDGDQLTDQIRQWGQWIKERAEQELADFYPIDSDGATPIAYLWARTIISEAPDDGTGIPVEIPSGIGVVVFAHKSTEGGEAQLQAVVQSFSRPVRSPKSNGPGPNDPGPTNRKVKLMNEQSIEQLRRRIGVYDRQQILIWQRMSPVERLEMAFQAYHFALETVRLTERQRHPDLSEEDFKWRVIRRMQGNQRLGREKDAGSDQLARTG